MKASVSADVFPFYLGKPQVDRHIFMLRYDGFVNNNYPFEEEKQMKKNLTELVFILDKSGSMSGLEKDTIGGYNSMLEQQRKEAGDVIISTVLFDSGAEVLHDRVNLSQIKNMTDKDYVVGGCTALLDAIGGAIHHINSVHKSLPEAERPEKTLFVITTDGMENSSRVYTYDKVKKMVQKKQSKKNWEFLFLGANMDAISAASDIGISAGRAATYKCDAAGTAVNYRALSKAITNFRRAEPMCAAKALDSWDEDVVADYEARKAE